MSLQQWLPAQDNPEVPVNENFSALSHMAVFAKDATTTTGLTWGYLGGRWGGIEVDGGTLTLSPSSTIYITVDRATGAIAASTTIGRWNDPAYGRVYKIVTGANTVTSIEDWRSGDAGIFAASAVSAAAIFGAPNVFTAGQSVATVAAGSSGVIAIDAHASNNFSVLMTGDVTIANPSNLMAGQVLRLTVCQDNVGGHAVTWGNRWRFAGGVTPMISADPDTADIVTATYDGRTGLLFCTIVQGFSAADAAVASAWPPISDENATWTDEGDSATGWTATGGSVAASGSVLRLTKSTTSSCNMKKAVTFPTAGRDFIFYGRVRASYANNDATLIAFANGGNEIGFWLGNTSTAYTAGAACLQAAASGSYSYAQITLPGGQNYASDFVDFAMQYDSKFGQANFWLRGADGRWKLGARIACVLTSATEITIAKNSAAPVGTWVEFDYLMMCKPNIVAIGDSHCAGSTLFNPNRTLALANDESTWMRHAHLYPSLRNNLVVNKGVGAQTSAQIASRISDATLQSPRVVALHASANDTPATVTSSQRTANISNAIAACDSAGCDVVLLNALYGTSTHSDNPAYRDYMQAWWDASASAVGAYSAIDIMEPVRSSSGFLLSTFAQPDGVHLTTAGYAAVGAHIEAAVTE